MSTFLRFPRQQMSQRPFCPPRGDDTAFKDTRQLGPSPPLPTQYTLKVKAVDSERVTKERSRLAERGTRRWSSVLEAALFLLHRKLSPHHENDHVSLSFSQWRQHPVNKEVLGNEIWLWWLFAYTRHPSPSSSPTTELVVDSHCTDGLALISGHNLSPHTPESPGS